MGTCDTLLNRSKSAPINEKKGLHPKIKKKGSYLYCAPVDVSSNNDNIYVNNNSMMSQTTMTQDMSHYQSRKPQVYQYINKYKTNGLQKSIAKASLVEMGGAGNSLMMSNTKNSGVNQINSFYNSKAEDTGYESSYEGCEMIIDGKMDEELVRKSSDKNTINNYNEFIKKKEDNNINNKKVLNYYQKNSNNSNINKKLSSIIEEKDGDDLSRIPSGPVNQIKNGNNNLNNYIKSMGKY